jgi:hypothetical protein
VCAVTRDEMKDPGKGSSRVGCMAPVESMESLLVDLVPASTLSTLKVTCSP